MYGSPLQQRNPWVRVFSSPAYTRQVSTPCLLTAQILATPTVTAMWFESSHLLLKSTPLWLNYPSTPRVVLLPLFVLGFISNVSVAFIILDRSRLLPDPDVI